MTTRPERAAAIEHFIRDRKAAHAILFAHRHPLPFAEFHGEMIDAWHGPRPKVSIEAFRNGAKSTIGEEAVTLMGGLREFHNGIVVGASEQRAMERLEAIKSEIETNDMLTELFGDQRGPVWSGHKAELKSGRIIQAVGVGQSLRGIKYHQYRPDFCWIDDIEDEESVRSPEARTERLRWLYNTLLPALTKDARVRMTGNRLDAEAVIAKVAADEAWLALRFPVRYRGKEGAWVASWPEQFDLAWIEKSRAENERMGNLDGWEREYMCEAVAAERKIFKAETLDGIVRPRVRTWEPAYAMFDPARTVGQKSATTGRAVWSWVGNKLVVWDADARLLMPDQQIASIFDTADRFWPVVIGVEEDGLNEFILQPLRIEMLRRRQLLPIKPVRAPRGKLDFIAALHPLFLSDMVEFAKDLPDLKQQLLNFPSGRIDAPNALAYAPTLRPGQPIYEDFGFANVDEPPLASSSPAWLAMNTDGTLTSGVLCQFAAGTLRVLADWIEEGDAGQRAAEIAQEANLEAGRTVRCVGGPAHFVKWTNRGLMQAVARIPSELRQGLQPERGRDVLRTMLRRQARGLPSVTVSTGARWTLNGFAGGFARAVVKGGAVADHPQDGPYRTLMEGLESFVGLLGIGIEDEEREGLRMRTSRDGRSYVTTMPARE